MNRRQLNTIIFFIGLAAAAGFLVYPFDILFFIGFGFLLYSLFVNIRALRVTPAWTPRKLITVVLNAVLLGLIIWYWVVYLPVPAPN